MLLLSGCDVVVVWMELIIKRDTYDPVNLLISAGIRWVVHYKYALKDGHR